MTKRLICALVTASLALGTLACGSTSVTQMTGPDSPRCQTTLGAVPPIPAAGGRVDVGVGAQRECSWTAASNTSWIQISPTSGQGEASITLTTSANPQGTTRTGNITVNGSQYSVTQAAAPCTFTVTPADISMPSQGGSAGVRVSTLIGCTWSATSPTAWVTVNPSSGTGTGEVALALGPNSGSSVRSADLTIAGRTVTVTQAAAAPGTSPAPGPTPAPPGSCTYDIDPMTRTLRGKGGDATVKVTTTAGCAWTAASNVSWAQIKDGATGLGSGDVKYQVDRNTTGFARTGTLTIAGLTHLIVQSAGD